MAQNRDRLEADEIVLLHFESEAGTSHLSRQSNGVDYSMSVQCYTEVVHLQEAPTYVALSYAWGGASNKRPIYIDGEQVLITPNLESALVHVRSRVRETEALWVDALCINQEDDVEKSEQVAHMRDIYANAVRVIVWLGRAEDSPKAHLALDWLMSYGGRAATLSIASRQGPTLRSLLSRHKKALPSDDDSTEAKDLKMRRLCFADELKNSLDINKNPDYMILVNSIRSFMSRTYWERMWVVQEFASAKKHDFVCGSRPLDFHALMYAFRILGRFRMWQLETNTSASIISETAPERYGQAVPQFPKSANALFLRAVLEPGDLLYLLRMYSTSKARDPRDHIFALLGIARDANALGLLPDYTKSTVQVYTEVARALLRVGHFDVLSLANPRFRDTQDLQSWVPDWSSKISRSCLTPRILHPGAKESVLATSFKASASLEQPDMSISSTHAWDRPITLSVIPVCSVAAVGRPWHEDGVGDWLYGLFTLASSRGQQSEAGGLLRDAVWHTAAAGEGLLYLPSMKKHRLEKGTICRLNAALSNTRLQDIDGDRLMAIGLPYYRKAILNAAEGRRGLLTSTDQLGCAADDVEVGDLIVIVLGAKVPYVVRKRSHGNGYIMLGEAYVHGYMDGEAADANAAVEQIELH